MALLHIPLEQITESHLAQLIASRANESRYIDYKQSTYGGRDADHAEFRADITSFANTAGGDVVIGIAEKNSIPTGLMPFLGDMGAEKLRLEGMARTGIENPPTYDYHRLKMFSLSLLWRAAASARPEFRGVDLGPLLPRLTDMVMNKRPGDAQSFGTVIARFTEGLAQNSGILSPYKERLTDINFYRFVLGSYVFHIKADSRKCPDPLASLFLAPNSPLMIAAREFTGGPEHRAFLDTVKRSAALYPR